MRQPAGARTILWDVNESESERKGRFAYALRRARERRGLTAPQLAERLGVVRGTVNRWEDPARKDAPSILQLGALCSALGVDPRLFAVLPPEPPSEVDDYLIAATLEGMEEGLRPARRRRRADDDASAA
jgi:transcriptional regulator with XRE-family HTH domain